MGFLRLILAFCVMASHSQESRLYFFPPSQAVSLFFIISGFYMALILDGKYSSTISFYASRALRIFPLYWIMLAITIILGFIKTWLNIGTDENAILHYIKFSGHLTGPTAIFEAMNFALRNITLIINKDYFDLNANISQGYLILYQAWTLQVELLFYLIVPFILKIKKHLFLSVLVYCLVFLSIIQPFSVIPHNTLTYEFLVCVIYFLLGLCSYQYVYKKISKLKVNKFHKIILISFVLYILLYQILPIKLLQQNLTSIFFYIGFAFLLPFIFVLTKKNKFDRFLGELSYPIYVSHLIFVKILLSLPHPHIPFFNISIVSSFTIIFSIFMVRFVQFPIDKFRHKNK